MPNGINFTKYQGTGNDFIVLDGFSNKGISKWPDDLPKFARTLCDRHFGIGSDGLIIIRPSELSDFFMDFYNPDGSQSFCGNGSRCAVDFFRSLTGRREHFSFEAIDGLHFSEFSDRGVKIKMSLHSLPVQFEQGMILQTGSPHYVLFVDEIKEMDVVGEARKIRYSAEFAEKGINVNFVALHEGGIAIRTYERGVEDETLSCGTGVTAAALAGALKYGLKSPVRVISLGGILQVYFELLDSVFQNIWLEGPAVEVFRGVFPKS